MYFPFSPSQSYRFGVRQFTEPYTAGLSPDLEQEKRVSFKVEFGL
jgi:hypothetical protein